jgi:catechol 2,3-dioxygenase-like lactoylglutathione lyase family enzyme
MGLKINNRGRMQHGGVFVCLVDKKTRQKLELNWYPKNNRFYVPYKKGEELDHLAFEVEDVDAKVRELVERGAQIATKQFSDWRSTLAYVKDPDGIWLEIIGPKKNTNTHKN